MSRKAKTEKSFAALCMHVCLFQPNMPSVIVMQELEAYWKRQGEIPYELFAPRFEILRHGNTKRRYGFIWDLLEKGIEDGCFRCDLDLNLTHAWISVSFSGMLIRIATNPESYHDSGERDFCQTDNKRLC